jgi:hypothetical protein
MTLTGFVKRPEVIDRIKPLRPKPPHTIPAPLRAKPPSDRYAMVGTAFHYLLWFELQRRAPHAVMTRWVAEYAPEIIWRETPTRGGKGTIGFSGLRGENNPWRAKEQRKHAEAVLENAGAALRVYSQSKVPTRDQLTDLARHAIRLAKLDDPYRAGRLDPHFEQADSVDVEDLLDVLEIVPFESLLHSELLILNPDFKQSSKLVGNADADLIAGDLLVDFKVTKADIVKEEYWDQLLGYYLLARNQRRLDPTFPEIKRVAIYFSRHAYLWSVDATAWTNHPQFKEVEQWFFIRAKEVAKMPPRRMK